MYPEIPRYDAGDHKSMSTMITSVVDIVSSHNLFKLPYSYSIVMVSVPVIKFSLAQSDILQDISTSETNSVLHSPIICRILVLQKPIQEEFNSKLDCFASPFASNIDNEIRGFNNNVHKEN